MNKTILMIIALMLSSCAVNHGFPREVGGTLKPINDIGACNE